VRGGAAIAGCDAQLLPAAAGLQPQRRRCTLKHQVKDLDDAADDMMDRFVLFAPIVPDGRRVTTPVDAPYTVLEPKEMSSIRAQFHIPAREFVVLLLDEDGKAAFRSAVPVNTDRLNALIDRMRRRQAEMRRPHAN
jgi:hypothetical protein